MPSSVVEVGDTIISKLLLVYSLIDSAVHMGKIHLPHWDYIIAVRMWFCQDSAVGVMAAKVIFACLKQDVNIQLA